MGKAKRSEHVGKEWLALAFPEQRLDPAEKKRRWAELYRLVRTDDKWSVGSEDAHLVSSMGTYLAIEEKRWEEASRLCKEFLDHPDARFDQHTFDFHLILSGCMEILRGNAEEGAKALLDRLDTEKPGRLFLLLLRGDLLGTLGELGDGATPSPLIAHLTSRTIAGFRGNKRSSKKALSAASYRELRELLESAVRPRNPPQTSASRR